MLTLSRSNNNPTMATTPNTFTDTTSFPLLRTAPLLLLFLIFILYQYILYPAFFSPLSRIPNAHWSSPFSRLWILSIRWNRRENRTVLALHRRLDSSVIRVGPKELSINDIDGVRTVYQGGFDKPDWYSVFNNYGWVAPTEYLSDATQSRLNPGAY